MELHRHPPERRRRGVVLAAHGCCCCCCCCLHSLCGLVGSAVASGEAKSPEAKRTVWIYWGLALFSTAVGVAGISVQESFGVALVLAALGLPLAQLNASFLTLCASLFVAVDLRTLGRVTWKGFWWGLVGFLVMAVPLMLMSYLG